MRGLLPFLFLLTGAASAPDHVKYPNSGRAWRAEAARALEAKDRKALARAAAHLARMGATVTARTAEVLRPMLDDARVERHFVENAKPVGVSTPFASVPAEYRLVEGIALDSQRNRLFVGTVVEGRLAYVEEGSWHEVALPGPRGGIFGIAVDPAQQLLWITMASVEQTAIPGERFEGLMALNLETLTIARRVPLPAEGDGAQLNDLAIAQDGSVYASDAAKGAVYRCAPGCSVLDAWLKPGTFRNPQGLVADGGGKRLYVADYPTGLWLVDCMSGATELLRAKSRDMLDGIDGLVSASGSLYAIQNGTNPRRIIGVFPARDGKRIAATDVRAVLPPEAGEPTLGTIAFEPEQWRLLYIADGQWERYGKGGTITDGKPLKETPINSIVLSQFEIIVTDRR